MRAILYPLLLVPIYLISCSAPFKGVAPRDFAVVESKNTSKKEYQALHPDGLMYRISVEPNEPKANLAFWTEAMKKDLSSKGYELLSSDRHQYPAFQREWQLWSIPTEGMPQFYWIWLRAGVKHILIAESGGSSLIFPKIEADLQKASDTIPFYEKDYQP